MLTLDLVSPGAGRGGQFAAYLLADGEPALVDCGAGSHAASLRAELAAHGVPVGDLRHLFVTHVHLDHAGGAGALVRENPRLTVWVHRRGARHLVDPGRLVASARRVFGELYDRLWGETLPVPAENVRAIDAAGPLPVARGLEALLAPGHAKHEVVYLTGDGTAVAGDVCGVALDGNRFLEPPTPPPDVDVDAWLATLGQVQARAPRRLALGHFGSFEDPAGPLDDLGASLRRRAGWAAGEEAAFVERAQAEVRAAVGEGGQRSYHRGSGLRTDYAGLRRWWEGRQVGRLATGGPR